MYVGYDVDDEDYSFYDVSSGVAELRTIKEWQRREPLLQTGTYEEDRRYAEDHTIR